MVSREFYIQSALRAISEENLSIRRAAERYGVPKTTLADRASEKYSSYEGRRTKLSTITEKNLVNLLKTMSDIGFSLRNAELIEVVPQYLISTNQTDIFKDGVPTKTKTKKKVSRFHDQI